MGLGNTKWAEGVWQTQNMYETLNIGKNEHLIIRPPNVAGGKLVNLDLLASGGRFRLEFLCLQKGLIPF